MQIQPNTLTDEWGGTYLQVIIALLVLAAGIPGILLQLRTAPEIHRVVTRRRYDRIRVMSGMITIYVFVALLFIWVFDSSPTTRNTHVGNDWSAASVISLMLVLTSLIWLRQYELTDRERIIRRLTKEAISEFRKRRTLSDLVVADYLDLGTSASRQDERRLVLNYIAALSRAIRKIKGYNSEGLEQLMQVVGRIAADPMHPVDEETISLAASILLKNTETSRMGGRKGALLTADTIASARTFMWMLGRVSPRIDESVTNLLLSELSAVGTFPPTVLAKGLFQTGKDSLVRNQYALVVTCLSHLEDVLNDCPAFQVQTVEAYLIGLAAHMWNQCPAGRERVAQRPVIAKLIRSLNRERRRAYMEFYYDESDFQTVGFISDFYAEVGNLRALSRHERYSSESAGPDSTTKAWEERQRPVGTLMRSFALIALLRLLR